MKSIIVAVLRAAADRWRYPRITKLQRSAYAYEQIRRRCVAEWGQPEKWTWEQHAAYIAAVNQHCDEVMRKLQERLPHWIPVAGRIVWQHLFVRRRRRFFI